MLIRRCFALLTEAADLLEFDAARLVQDGAPWRTRRTWRALAGHLDEPIEISETELLALGRLPVEDWQELQEDSHDADVWPVLLQQGLVISDGAFPLHREADDQLRRVGWHGASAVFHRYTRWNDSDARIAARALETLGDAQREAVQGPAPDAVLRRAAPDMSMPLPRPAANALDELLASRVTCRNFDPRRSVPLVALSACLFRAFGAQAVGHAGTRHTLLKKYAPSAGGLHPADVFVFVRNVQGLSAGAYHYLPDEHALEPLSRLAPADLPALCARALAGQDWFVDAPVLLALGCRFDRSYWKYREHAKTYRAMALDLGHASQLLYLGATEQGLGCFITSAINERPLDKALGLDPVREGILAMSGLGYRGETRREVEFDPQHRVWPDPTG